MLEIDVGGGKKVVLTSKPASAKPPATPAARASAPQVISEHGRGGGSSSSDTGKKPTQQQTKTGYATPASTQPKGTAPQVVSEHGQGGGSGSSDTGKEPTTKEIQSGYATSPGTRSKSGGQTSTSSRAQGGGSGSSGGTRLIGRDAIPGDTDKATSSSRTKPAEKLDLTSSSLRTRKADASKAAQMLQDATRLRVGISGRSKRPITTVIRGGLVDVVIQSSAFATLSVGRGSSLDVSLDPRSHAISVSNQYISFDDPGLIGQTANRLSRNQYFVGERASQDNVERDPLGSPLEMSVKFAGGQSKAVTVGHIEYAASMTIDRTGLPKYDVEIKTDFDVTAPNGLKSTVAYGVDTSISVDDHLPQHSVPVERRRAVQLDPKIVLAIAAGTVPISVLAKILGRARTATQTPAPVFG